eukprot:TRINITY_DN9219_c0_g8_i1.p1 TRINITY_DN9219_c0_g8~~TRINITY_DN9219_c0_g8_i1.p1  ORF type:complete len:530 (+),score=90.34 TRINITY_DN9219_c0_g8_i1:236-1591(+)
MAFCCSFGEKCRDNEVEVGAEEVKRLIGRFGVSELDYDHFLQLILPYHVYLRFAAVKRLTYDVPCHARLNFSFENLLATIIRKEIDIESRLEKYRSLLSQRHDFSIPALLSELDTKRKNFINETDVAEFLRQRGYEDKSELFVRRLDIDMDGKLSYSEFEKGVKASGLVKEYPKTETKILYEPRVKTNPYGSVAKCKDVKEEYTPSQYTFETSYASPYRNQKQKSLPTTAYKKTNYSYKTDKMNSYIKEIYAYEIDSNRDMKAEIKTQAQTVSQGAVNRQLAEAIKALILIERELEQHKVNLALQSDFNLIDGFRLFDRSGKCYVTLEEFQRALNKLGLKSSGEKLYLRYSRNQDDKLDYTDFCNMILPKDTNYAYTIHKRHPLKGEFSSKTLDAFKTLIEKSIELEEAGEKIRKELKSNGEFDAYRHFKEVDCKGKGQITLSEVEFTGKS